MNFKSTLLFLSWDFAPQVIMLLLIVVALLRSVG
jgi:hypothetical protein